MCDDLSLAMHGGQQEQRKAVKAQRRAGLSGKALLDDFGDDVADLVDMADGLGRQSGCALLLTFEPSLLWWAVTLLGDETTGPAICIFAPLHSPPAHQRRMVVSGDHTIAIENMTFQPFLAAALTCC